MEGDTSSNIRRSLRSSINAANLQEQKLHPTIFTRPPIVDRTTPLVCILDFYFLFDNFQPDFSLLFNQGRKMHPEKSPVKD